MRFGMCLVVAIILGSVFNQAEIQLTEDPTAQVLSEIERQQLKSRKPTDKSVAFSELLSRLNLVASGRDLSIEAWNRTRETAAAPEDGYGMLNSDGFKWQMAIYILRVKAQTERTKALEDSVRELREEVRRLKEQRTAQK